VSLGGDDPEPEFLDEDETPDAVAEAKPLAADFMQEVTPHYEDATVRLNEKGEIAVDYRTTLENQSGVKRNSTESQSCSWMSFGRMTMTPPPSPSSLEKCKR